MSSFDPRAWHRTMTHDLTRTFKLPESWHKALEDGDFESLPKVQSDQIRAFLAYGQDIYQAFYYVGTFPSKRGSRFYVFALE